MKLNNRGWGIKEMLVLSMILVFFFGIAIYFIYSLYMSLDFEINNDSEYITYKQYEALEEKLENKAEEYLEYEFNDYKNEDVININELIKADYVDYIYDPNTGGLCEAYVVVKDVNYFSVKAYIKCDEYQTEGYKEL